ncbi:hypothetical protein STEG23_025963 [Scotinomys teguina]
MRKEGVVEGQTKKSEERPQFWTGGSGRERSSHSTGSDLSTLILSLEATSACAKPNAAVLSICIGSGTSQDVEEGTREGALSPGAEINPGKAISLFTKPLHLNHLHAENSDGTLVDTLGNPDAEEACCGRGSLEGIWILLISLRPFISIAEESIPGASSALDRRCGPQMWTADVDRRCGAEMFLINRDFCGLNISSTIGELTIPRIPVENPFGE